MDGGPLLRRFEQLRSRRLNASELADTIVDLAHSEFVYRDDVQRELVELAVHEDCDVRAEALSALAYHGVDFRWDVDPGRLLLRRLLQMTASDPNPDCRRAAVAALGSFFRGTHHCDVMEAIAHVGCKTDEAADVRAFAYVALMDVIGIPKGDQPSPINLRIGPIECSEMVAHLRRNNVGGERS